MDYTQLFNELNKASTFDLYRFHVAIVNELENPKRVSNIKQRLRIGSDLSYFNSVENRLIRVKLLEMRQKNVVVFDYEKNNRLVIPYYMLNLDQIDTNIYESKNVEPLSSNSVKFGDYVGFNRDGENIIGIVKRINYKTVTIETNTGHLWRVAYSLLYRIYEANTNVI